MIIKGDMSPSIEISPSFNAAMFTSEAFLGITFHLSKNSEAGKALTGECENPYWGSKLDTVLHPKTMKQV